jgi:F-type H+-transporting ATPase subunit b
MLIDWFTVGAQALNFLILVWLLKRFLYKPILSAIDAREARIAAELADADKKKAEAKTERDALQARSDAFDQERTALLTKATEEAKAERQRLLDEARKAADTLSAKRREALENDARNLDQAISRLVQQEVFAVARKALADLGAASLEERIGAVFIRRLREMEGPAKAKLGEALKVATTPAIVRCAIELPQDQRAAIQNAINEAFSADIKLKFDTAPDLVGGIELSGGGQKVAWSIADYLASLEKSIGELAKAKDNPNARAEPAPEAKDKPAPEHDPGVETKSQPETAG